MTSIRPAIALISLVLATLLSGCGGKWSTIRQGTWNGQHYTVEERSSAGLFASTNSLDWRIKVGSLPAVPVNANTTDWGPPYTTDLYGTDAYSFIAARDTAYVDTPFTPGRIGVAHTMLYILPGTLNEEQYETFLHFMVEEFPRLSDSLTGGDLREFPHLIGLVYGDHDRYVRDFHGMHEGAKRRLRIEPDGRVRLMEDNSAANEVYSGLSSKVHMPGRVLHICADSTGSGLTADDLRGFRDANDQPVETLYGVLAIPAADCK